MSRKQLFVLLLLLSPALASADDDEGKPKRWWSTPLIIIVYIGFFLFAAAVAFGIRQFRERHINVHYLNGHGMAAERGLDADEIESLPSLRFSEMKMHKLGVVDQQLECTVCLSEFKDQEVLRILPDCLHVFHPQCIAPWLASHVTCPTCRSSLEHRQGSSVSMSSIFDSTSGPFSQRFDHSGDQHDNHDDDHVTVEIEESSTLHSEVNLDGAQLTSSIRILSRSYSTGDLTMVDMVQNNSSTTTRTTSLSTLFHRECSPKSDYHTAVYNKADHMSCISPKSDSFADYSSLIIAETSV